MSEISSYEAQVKKMQGLCEEHNLVYRFRNANVKIGLNQKSPFSKGHWFSPIIIFQDRKW